MTKFHKIFKLLDWQFDANTYKLSLSYEVENIGKVTEILTFPAFNQNVDNNQIVAACDLVHLMCGVSYYKAGLAKKIIFEKNKPSTSMASFIAKTWKHGLAELAFANDISLKGHININGIEGTIIDGVRAFDFISLPIKSNALTPSITPSILVALGGGKDSLVTIEELKEQGKNINLFMVGNSQLIKDVAGFIELPLIQVQRKIDTKLLEYNKTGKGFNGHVPITAINSCIAILTALLFDCDEVVFSNEKSADSGNIINSDGEEVNHQYSKSYEFERDFSKILATEVSKKIKYYSQQRQFSELEILEKFAKYPQYFPIFSSCNRNFHIDGSKNKQTKWCCDCPKCRFVFLGLAPFVKKSQLLDIFKHNMLDDITQQHGYAELLGVTGFKPFECVGEIAESQQAFRMVQNQHEWQGDKLIKFFKDNIGGVSIEGVRAFDFISPPIKSNALTPSIAPSILSKLKLAIWGFGVEGQATARYLTKQQINFKVLCKQAEVASQYECLVTEVDVKLLNSFDLVIKSPGISPYTDLVRHATCQFTSATAIWFANEKHTKVIAITGTKGKSTIVSLLAHILQLCGKSVNLVGNIGNPLITSSSNYDYIVLESSSFQIFDGNIMADIALINNLFAEHIDWHLNKENYFKDKIKILDNAKIKILNAQNKTLNMLVKGEDLILFNDSQGYYVDGAMLYFNHKVVLSASEVQLIGKHNLENIAAVLTICKQLNLSIDTCIAAIKGFKPLAHRLQDLGKIGNHYAINDSIATTPIATLAAMQTFDLDKITLLVGGFDRGHDWSEFAQALNDKPAKLLIAFGQSGTIINNYLQSISSKINFKLSKNLATAIEVAKKHTLIDHIILLSPGAPSFDEFTSYIQRGEFFASELKKFHD